MSLEQTLREAAQFVLETMFFAESEPVAAPDNPQPGQIFVWISFQGQRRGMLAIGMPESHARALAGSFEGLPDPNGISMEIVDQVAAELANMICGATLTRLDHDGLFTLNSPSLTRDLPAALEPLASECWLQIAYMGDGLMHLALALENRS